LLPFCGIKKKLSTILAMELNIWVILFAIVSMAKTLPVAHGAIGSSLEGLAQFPNLNL
jgi:hypothetical protein